MAVPVLRRLDLCVPFDKDSSSRAITSVLGNDDDAWSQSIVGRQAKGRKHNFICAQRDEEGTSS